MKKKIFLVLLALLIFVLAVTVIQKPLRSPQEKTRSGFSKGIWLSYFEENFDLSSKTAFEKSVDVMYTKLSENNIDSLFIHCRAFCDAIYKSELFPMADNFRSDGKIPDFDPLTVICEYADKYRISVHAWINPYRVSTSKKSIDELPDDSAAKRLYSQDNDSVICCDKGIYLNPANQNANKLILDGVREIIDNYDVDGIHFDDYFYPTTDESFDKGSYDEYKKSGGELKLSDWRRANVDAMVSGVYGIVHSSGKNMKFGISPMCDIETNYAAYYADVKKWTSESGYIDYICPQIYFGYNHPTQPFAKSLKKWKALAQKGNTELYVGLAAYKVGTQDDYISESNPDAKNEWVNDELILYRQAEQLVNDESVSGFIIFSFDNFFSDDLAENRKAISDLRANDITDK